MLDIHHTPFAHRRVMPGTGTRLDPYDVEVSGPVIRTSGVLRKDDGKPYSGEGGLHFRFWARFPGLALGVLTRHIKFIAAMTPIDDRARLQQQRAGKRVHLSVLRSGDAAS